MDAKVKTFFRFGNPQPAIRPTNRECSAVPTPEKPVSWTVLWWRSVRSSASCACCILTALMVWITGLGGFGFAMALASLAIRHSFTKAAQRRF